MFCSFLYGPPTPLRPAECRRFLERATLERPNIVELLSRVSSAILGNKEERACTFRMKTNSLNCSEKPLRPTTPSKAHSAIQTKIGLSGMRNETHRGQTADAGGRARSATRLVPNSRLSPLHGRTAVWHSIYCA